ncbi:T9SS type A sorting domain-containing protein [Mesonia sp. MT50]|uniref:T9SS type A sorting domain-containing protein n=1 Tax=Mesonia profundi TaxID=3070998 RepID=A0ABU0ZXD8_9FLAO|nr:T9SS type A sorting domain-containing protein [Mesonia profundi]MDQ7916133.1 T9SS type A sorting domain-containing protein [Mesonia profundi]
MKIIIKLIICLLSFNSLAQIAPLEDHTWYLEKLVINGNDFPPPLVYQDNYTASFDNDYFIFGSPCSSVEGILTHNSTASFAINEGGSDFQICPGLTGVDAYDEKFAIDFIDIDDFLNPFSYTFATQPNYIVLTITNGNGDQAIYRNQQLAVASMEKVAVNLYPNPVTNHFQLEVESGKNIKSVRIFSVDGKEVLHFEEAQITYDVSYLPAGIYFVKIKSETGESVKKMLKR